jgi:hypothetical protein
VVLNHKRLTDQLLSDLDVGCQEAIAGMLPSLSNPLERDEIQRR